MSEIKRVGNSDELIDIEIWRGQEEVWALVNKPCKYAKKYKAIRKPTCGCLPCQEKWESKNE